MSENGLLITLGEDGPIYHDLSQPPPESPPFDFEAALKEYAAAEQRLAVTELMCERFHELYIQPYEEAIAAQKQVMADLKAKLTEAARAAALDDGDFHPHPNLEVKRKPQTWKYDEQEMLKRIQEEAEAETLDEAQRASLRLLLRIKTELNKNALNAALKDNKFPWLPATPAPQDVIVSIRPLGDLAIQAAFKDETES